MEKYAKILIDNPRIKSLEPYAFKLYVILCGYAKPDGTGAFPTNETLLEDCGYGLSSLMKSFRTLEESGLIEREVERNNAGTWRRFWVNISVVETVGRSGGVSEDNPNQQKITDHSSYFENVSGPKAHVPLLLPNNRGVLSPNNRAVLLPDNRTKEQNQRRTEPENNIVVDSITENKRGVENPRPSQETTTKSLEPFEPENPAQAFSASQHANLQAYGLPGRRPRVNLVTLPEPMRVRVERVLGPDMVSEVEGMVCQDMLETAGFVEKVLGLVEDRLNRPGGLDRPIGYFHQCLKSQWKDGNYRVLAQAEAAKAAAKAERDAERKKITDRICELNHNVKRVWPYDGTPTKTIFAALDEIKLLQKQLDSI